jgi:hypothetical protein
MCVHPCAGVFTSILKFTVRESERTIAQNTGNKLIRRSSKEILKVKAQRRIKIMKKEKL